jgi:predicted ATPase
MIARIEALNYRCLRDVAQELAPFNVLVGPNGSGKSTFLDVVGLLSDFLANGLDDAILLGPDPSRPRGRSSRVEELFFRGHGDRFELAVELEIPGRLRREAKNGAHERARYEVAFGRAGDSQELAIIAETFWLRPKDEGRGGGQTTLFPEEPPLRKTLLVAPEGRHAPRGWRRVVNKIAASGNDNFQAETSGWNMPFKSGPRRAALANLPEDPDRFPVAVWARELLLRGLQRIALNVEALRRPCSPSLPTKFSPDGSNLPRVASALRSQHPQRFDDWVAHVRTVLPDLENVEVVTSEVDRSLYFRLSQGARYPVPSWLLSDGTLRMLVLTILPYLGTQDNVYLIEEPENGVHPQAIEAIYDALSGVYENQVLLATHSPLVLGRTEPRHLLCFTRSKEGSAVLVRGSEHPRLQDWRGEVDLATLYAAGVLS